jgi:putative hemolysin
MMTGDGFAFEVALVAALILLNGFFAGAEIAVISARRGRIQPRARAGDRRAQALLRLKADPDRFLATVQIGVTLVGTLASAVGGVAAVERLKPLFAALPLPWLQELAEPAAVAIVVFVIAFLSLVVGELVPKSLAVRHADTLALWVARPIDGLARLAGFAVAVLTAATGLVLRLLGQRGQTVSPFNTVEDIRAILDEADQQGVLDGDVVKGAVEFQDSEARHLMTSRSRVVGIPRSSSIEAALRIARESGYSRFPVYERDLDSVDGVIHAKDLFEARERGAESAISPLVRPALVAPVARKAKDLLADMRRAQTHMALVVDEHGSVAGIVTLEDIFEAIVGDISDEHDGPEREVRVVRRDLVETDGGVAVRELNSRYGLSLPESDDYVTVAGLLLGHLGSVPKGGERVEVGPYRLTVATMAGRRIASVTIETVGAAQPA